MCLCRFVHENLFNHQLNLDNYDLFNIEEHKEFLEEYFISQRIINIIYDAKMDSFTITKASKELKYLTGEKFDHLFPKLLRKISI